jgi:hypothetical protein
MKHLIYTSAAILAALLLTVSPARADRYHVTPDGTMIDGVSIADNWNLDNCYSSLQDVAAIATVTDTILLDYGQYTYLNSNTLPALIANRNLDLNSENFTVVLMALSGFYLAADQNDVEIRGITFTAESVESDRPLFDLAPESSNFHQFFLNGCRFFNLNSSALGGSINIGGGVLRAQSSDQTAILRISSCEFRNNFSRGNGGAIGITDGWNVLIYDSNFTGNYSHPGFGNSGLGGAIALNSPNRISHLSLYNCVVDSSYSSAPGGAIAVDDGTITLSSTHLLNSVSGVEHSTGWQAGAGIFMRATEGSNESDRFLIITDCLIKGNTSYSLENTGAGDGGGVLVKGFSGHMTDVTVNNTIFENNFNMQGGGLYIGRFATGSVNRCTFLNNRAFFAGGGSFKGGAFYGNMGETAEYNYCSFIGNEAGVDKDGNAVSIRGWGGGFSTRLYPRAIFTNCTFLNNGVYGTNIKGNALYAHHEGTSFNDPDMRCVINNCVFWGTAGTDIQINVPEYAIETVTNCAFGSGEFVCVGVTPVNTVELTENPCISLTDITLVADSPCIDMAFLTEFETDLFGNPVPSGVMPDIGAMEFMQLTPVQQTLPTHNLVVAPAFPNPFNPSTTLVFYLEEQSKVTVDIVDISGRLIHSTNYGTLLSGQHIYSWNGSNNEGNSLPSGHYFAIFKAGSEQNVQKLVLLK